MGKKLCIILLWLPASLISQHWIMDSSRISFKIKNAGLVVNGSFSGVELQCIFDPRDLGNALISASVDASTIYTGIRIRDKHLCRPDYFDIAVFPRISMISQDIQKSEPSEFLGNFSLSLKGKQDQVSFPFTYRQQGKQALLEGSFEIDRRDYDIGGQSILLDDTVTVEIWIKLHQE